MFDKLLVPTDGSENSQHALVFARSLLEKGISHHLTVVHVVPRITDENDHGSELQHRAQHLANFEGEKVIEITRAIFQDLPKVEYLMLRGIPSEEIVNYAKDNQIDLIVLGRQGISQVVEFFVGSTTNEVVRNSTVPVLTV